MNAEPFGPAYDWQRFGTFASMYANVHRGPGHRYQPADFMPEGMARSMIPKRQTIPEQIGAVRAFLAAYEAAGGTVVYTRKER